MHTDIADQTFLLVITCKTRKVKVKVAYGAYSALQP
jgi:hypothetical protein